MMDLWVGLQLLRHSWDLGMFSPVFAVHCSSMPGVLERPRLWHHIWRFPKDWGVLYPNSWMLFVMEHPEKRMIWLYPLWHSRNLHVFLHIVHLTSSLQYYSILLSDSLQAYSPIFTALPSLPRNSPMSWFPGAYCRAKPSWEAVAYDHLKETQVAGCGSRRDSVVSV